MAEIKVALFDIDHTLIHPSTLTMHPGISEILSPAARPFLVSHITARGAHRYVEVLNANPDLVPSPNMAVGLEYGTRVITAEDYCDPLTFRTVSHQSLNQEERAQIVTFVEDAPGQVAAAFYPEDPTHRRIVWTPDAAAVPVLEANYGEHSEVRLGTVEDFSEMLQMHHPGMVVCRVLNPEEDLVLPPGLVTYQYGYGDGVTIDFLPQASDKSIAAKAILENCGVSPEEALIAGDSVADLGMLSIQGVYAILVVSKKTRTEQFPPGIKRVTPATHGAYLAAIAPKKKTLPDTGSAS